MSSKYHRPTHTFENNAFNATQVRLYGLHNQLKLQEINEILKLDDISVQIKIKREKDNVPEDDLNLYFVKIGKNDENLSFMLAINLPGRKEMRSIGIICGYAYEGHCYDLPKPAIMLLPVLPEDRIPDNDCGFDKKALANYKVWVVDKLSECHVIEIDSGFVEQLVLEANLPGRRSPSMYSANMQLAHRSGRLTD